MTLNKKNVSILFTLSLVSAVTFALSVGQNIEIMEFLNARARANFIEPAVNNRVGVLTRGTHAEIQQVKRFKSGNSGLYIKVSDGPLSGQSVWVYYSKTSPSLKLATASGAATRDPAVTDTGVTTRPIAATPDPVLTPAPKPAKPPPAAAAGIPQVIPTPPPVVAPGAALPGLIGSANGAVGGMSPGGNAGCRDCPSDISGSSGTGNGKTVPAPVPPAVVAPVSAAEAARDPGLNYFAEMDSQVTAPRGASAALIRAHKFSLLRMKMGNFALHCDNYKYNRDLTGRTMNVDQARRASDPASYYARWNAYLNSTLRPINSDSETAFGGANQMERSPAITAYMNRSATLLESPANLYMPSSTPLQYCQNAEKKFNAILNLSAQDFRSYLDMPDSQRHSYLSARAR